MFSGWWYSDMLKRKSIMSNLLAWTAGMLVAFIPETRLMTNSRTSNVLAIENGMSLVMPIRMIRSSVSSWIGVSEIIRRMAPRSGSDGH